VEARFHALGSIVNLILGAEVADGEDLHLVVSGHLVSLRDKAIVIAILLLEEISD